MARVNSCTTRAQLRALYAAAVMNEKDSLNNAQTRKEEAAPVEPNSELGLTLSQDDGPALEADLVRRSSAGLLPAVRAALAPLVPPIRRAATIIAVAALTDWALRSISCRLLRRGLGQLSRKAGGTTMPRSASPAGARSETVIVERLIIHRSG